VHRTPFTTTSEPAFRLGALLTCAFFRLPGLLVKQATALDVLPGGRAYFGIGAGWYEREATGLGIPFRLCERGSQGWRKRPGRPTGGMSGSDVIGDCSRFASMGFYHMILNVLEFEHLEPLRWLDHNVIPEVGPMK